MTPAEKQVLKAAMGYWKKMLSEGLLSMARYGRLNMSKERYRLFKACAKYEKGRHG